jgi:hypothetical protein
MRGGIIPHARRSFGTGGRELLERNSLQPRPVWQHHRLIEGHPGRQRAAAGDAHALRQQIVEDAALGEEAGNAGKTAATATAYCRFPMPIGIRPRQRKRVVF